MSQAQELVSSIMQFLMEELRSETLSPETKESIEVGIQCLEVAYEIDRNSLQGSVPSLVSMYSEFLNNQSRRAEASFVELRERKRVEADYLKERGNDHMRAERYVDAVIAYSEAIQVDCTNAVYFCNRAAAHSKLGDFVSTIEDCKEAVRIDPSYGKAYSRMGHAHLNLNQIDEAVNCYRKAYEIEPDNEVYENNLRIVERRREDQNQQPQRANQPVNPRGVWSNDVFSMAAQMMQNTTIHNAVTNLLRETILQNSVARPRITVLCPSPYYRSVPQQNVPLPQQNVPMQQQNDRMSQQNIPVSQQNVPMPQQDVPMSQQNIPVSQQNVPMPQQNVAMRQQSVQDEGNESTYLVDMQDTMRPNEN